MSELHNTLFERTMDELRKKYYQQNNAIAIPRDDMHFTFYKNIVEECAKSVDHIEVQGNNLGNHIRGKMGLL
jgi:hypothetical protein